MTNSKNASANNNGNNNVNNAATRQAAAASYNGAVEKAAKDQNNARFANLNMVSNAAKKAHKGISTNEAIARYCGVKSENLRSYRQCVELGLTPAEIHALPVIDIWGRNNEDYANRTGRPLYYPRAAFEVPSEFLNSVAKLDGDAPAVAAANAAADMPDDSTTENKSDCIFEPTEEQENFAEAAALAGTPAEKVSKPRAARSRAAASDKPKRQYKRKMLATTDDLPF